MKRIILNLLAGATILVGGYALLSPASAAPEEACCKVTITFSDGSKVERECCGGRCQTEADGQCSTCAGAE